MRLTAGQTIKILHSLLLRPALNWVASFPLSVAIFGSAFAVNGPFNIWGMGAIGFAVAISISWVVHSAALRVNKFYAGLVLAQIVDRDKKEIDIPPFLVDAAISLMQGQNSLKPYLKSKWHIRFVIASPRDGRIAPIPYSIYSGYYPSIIVFGSVPSGEGLFKRFIALHEMGHCTPGNNACLTGAIHSILSWCVGGILFWRFSNSIWGVWFGLGLFAIGMVNAVVFEWVKREHLADVFGLSYLSSDTERNEILNQLTALMNFHQKGGLRRKAELRARVYFAARALKRGLPKKPLETVLNGIEPRILLVSGFQVTLYAAAGFCWFRPTRSFLIWALTTAIGLFIQSYLWHTPLSVGTGSIWKMERKWDAARDPEVPLDW